MIIEEDLYNFINYCDEQGTQVNINQCCHNVKHSLIPRGITQIYK